MSSLSCCSGVEKDRDVSEDMDIKTDPIDLRNHHHTLTLQNLKRGTSAPVKGMHPSHFKHGLRTYKHCIVCEGYMKSQTANPTGV